MAIRRDDVFWDEFFWKARVTIPSAQGFQCRGGPVEGTDPSDGKTELVFAPEGRDDRLLSDEELALVNWFLEREATVFNSVIQGIAFRYPALQQQYGYSDDEKDEYMPDVTTSEDLRRLVGLHSRKSPSGPGTKDGLAAGEVPAK